MYYDLKQTFSDNLNWSRNKIVHTFKIVVHEFSNKESDINIHFFLRRLIFFLRVFFLPNMSFDKMMSRTE